MDTSLNKLLADLNSLCRERLCLRIKKHLGELRKNHYFSLLNKKIVNIKKEIHLKRKNKVIVCQKTI